ncbi:MAG: hypothetical protein AAF223_19230 [Bacteroidota bacterium]
MKTVILFIGLFLLLFTACQEDPEVTAPADESPQEEVNFHRDKALFEEAAQLRSESYSSPFTIDYVGREENTLKVEVSYPKGCEGTFDVIWDGIVMESYPMQACLFLKFSATDCPTEFIHEDAEKKAIVIDLVALIGDESLVNETIFHVSNASSLQDVSCEGDCDQTVSSN